MWWQKLNNRFLYSTLALISVALIIALPQSVYAQQSSESAREELKNIRKEIKESTRRQEALSETIREANTEAESLATRMVRTANDIQIAERNVRTIEIRVANLEQNAREKSAELEERSQELVHLMAALERLSRQPAGTSLLRPGEALDTARSANLMGRMIPTVNNKAAALREDIELLADIRQDLSRQRFVLKERLSTLENHRRKLTSLLEQRRADAATARSAIEAEQQTLSTLAEQATSLEDLIEKLERQERNRRTLGAGGQFTPRAKPQTSQGVGTSFQTAKGQMPYPAIGALNVRFGERDGVITSKGIRIETRPQAQVVSPFDGRIVFAGPYRGYGQLLIIDHGEGYHSLLAGMADLYSDLGQWVLKGEPVGAMSPQENSEPGLYLEIRQSGKAVDPLPWLSNTAE